MISSALASCFRNTLEIKGNNTVYGSCSLILLVLWMNDTIAKKNFFLKKVVTEKFREILISRKIFNDFCI